MFGIKKAYKSSKKIILKRLGYKKRPPQGGRAKAAAHENFFKKLEERTKDVSYEDMYLWPRTPISSDHQDVIRNRVGADDRSVDDPKSRSHKIIRQIKALIKSNSIAEDFSILDVGCGDAVVLEQIKNAFPKACCYGVDCNIGSFDTHADIERKGVRFYNAYMQHLFGLPIGSRRSSFDIVLMLNSYRGWESADLREHERFLPQMADAWMEKNTNYVIVTATKKQVARLKSKSRALKKIGKGEENSVMICWSGKRGIPVSSEQTLAIMRSKASALLDALLVAPSWFLINFKRYGARDTASYFLFLIRGLYGKKIPLSACFAEKPLYAFLSRYKKRVKSESNTVYVFAFLGEFGYEILNWQGVVRKFSKSLPETSEIVIAGRGGLKAFYESAAQYIDISGIPLYRDSFAAAYFAMSTDHFKRSRPPRESQYRYDLALKKQIQEYVLSLLPPTGKRVRFVFSSDITRVDKCVFGVDARFYGASKKYPGAIYGTLDVGNNCYKKISPSKETLSAVKRKLGFDPVTTEYILVQNRTRAIGPQSGHRIETKPWIKALAEHEKVVFLFFDSGRNLDSGSFSDEVDGVTAYRAVSFEDQSCLIANAQKCVFFTEGDLGSHTYLPPFMGKDVYVIAHRPVFERSSAPVQFWNENVFKFGGQMYPVVIAGSGGRTAEEEIEGKIADILRLGERSQI